MSIYLLAFFALARWYIELLIAAVVGPIIMALRRYNQGEI